MYFIPKSQIKIGDVKLYGENAGINAVEINISLKDISDSAKITLPRNLLKKEGKGILEYIKVGDRVRISLGYDDNINEEFKGFVSKIGDGTPLAVEVDDDWYQFKKSEPINKSWAKTTLEEVLKFCFPGYTIECPKVNLTGGFIMQNATVFEAVKGLKDSYGFFAKIDCDTKKVNCFFPFDFTGWKTHSYVFGTRNDETLAKLRQRNLTPNVVKNDLKFERKEDLKLQITAIAKQKTGKDLKVTVGSTDNGATKRTLNYGHEITTEKALKEKAEQDLSKMSYDGYSGKVTGFGVPVVRSGDAVKIVDPENLEREGTYLVEAVKITYSLSGGLRRECTLSYKI